MPKRFFSFLAFLMGMALLSACGPYVHLSKIPFRTLTGVVVDINGEPIKGATVTTEPPTSSLLTDDLGKFLITGLPEGTYTLHVIKQGFMTNSILLGIKGSGPIHVDVQMTKKTINSPVEQEKLVPKIHNK